MDISAAPLVLTKLQVPATRTLLVPRARLVDLLNTQENAGFILVCAPAGYGKTTLLTEWAQSLTQHGAAVAWYALDSSDDAPVPCRSYLLASFIQAFGPLPELIQIARLFHASPEMDLQRIMPVIINAVLSSSREGVLILDDYHLIGAPAIHSALAFLLDHLPENLRVAIGSRSDPPLPLARLRAHRQMLEIRTADLRFRTDETTHFLNEIMQLRLSPSGVTVLEERTEGWITGLQLAALSLAGRADKEQVIASFTGEHRYLVDYLMDEIVSRQPEEVRSFLLFTSILERMCGDLCDTLRNVPSGGAAILQRLEQNNLFVVSLDEQGNWYRYHHLFRDFLRIRLSKTHPDRIPELHRTACDWLLGENLLREAAGHAFQTQDWEYAAAFVEQHSFTLISHGELSTLYEWCSPFPEEVMQRRPMLSILHAMAMAYGFRRQNRAKVEARLHQADQAIEAVENEQLVSELRQMASIVRTFLAFAPDAGVDPKELFAFAHNFLDAYPAGHPGQFSGLLLTGYAHMALHDEKAARETFETAGQIALREGLYFGAVESAFHQARLAQIRGALGRAVEICQMGKADIEAVLDNSEQELPALGSLDIVLGCVLMEWDRLEEAKERLLQGLNRMGGRMNPHYLMVAYFALFRLYEILGDSDEAMKTLDRLETVWPDMRFCTLGLRAAHSLRISPADPAVKAEAFSWCEEFSTLVNHDMHAPGMGPFGAADAYYLAFLTWAKIQISLGEPQHVFSYLDRQFEAVVVNDLDSRIIEISLCRALAWRAMGDTPQAWEALERALSTALPAGYIRIFDQSPALTQLLVEAAQRGLHQEYVERLLSSLAETGSLIWEQAKPAGRAVQPSFGEIVTEREMEVLRLIAQGATNSEIAEQLVITVGTVKSHVNHILRKLEAHNRTEAVARARRLGWLKI